MKYIIDIPEQIAEASEEYWEKSTGMTLEPYTEPDRKTIEDEVWEFSKVFYNMSDSDYDVCYGGEMPHTYQEAKAIYEKWEAEKDAINIGDEVKVESILGVVIHIENNECVVLTSYGKTITYAKGQAKRTGKTYPELAELFKHKGEKNGS